MATINRYGFVRHLRAEPNQYILHYRKGKIVREGAGVSYLFNPLSASVAQLPVEDCETTFLLKERTKDLQDVSVQVTIRYRVADPKRAAERINFTITPHGGIWTEQPLQTLATIWSERSQEPARSYLAAATLTDAIQSGADVIRKRLDDALRDDAELAAMGLALVDVRVIRAAATAEVEKALQTPTRESIQQKADEAIFARRAEAVEHERAIKENELATEIELERRQEDLIGRRGANELLEVQQKAVAARAETESEVELKGLTAEADAAQTRVRAESKADATRMIDEAKAAGERARVEAWKDAPSKVLLGLALQEFARKIETIQHLNVSPNLFGQAFEQFLIGEASK